MFGTRKIGFVIALLLSAAAAKAQYAVTGGAGTPLLAVDNTNFRIQVYLVYGVDNVQISYTSSSSSHKWYRYRTKVDELAPEAVASVQSGTTSTISDIEDGCGYYVDENGAMRRYVWIIDYSKYMPDLRSIEVSQDIDPCSALRLEGDADLPSLVYYTPSGLPTEVKREFEISYETLAWDEASMSFSPETYTETFEGDPFATSFPPPLADTEITLSGDMFARHFGTGASATTPLYQAKALEVHAYMTVNSDTTSGDGSSLSAPADISFAAYANEPAAALYVWTIVNDEDPDNPLVRFTSESVDYTFDRDGSYTAKLEVSDRTGECVNTDYNFQISITETEMTIPNAFSPGCTPGVNDFFVVSAKSVVSFQGWIFNRWGTELFRWTNPSEGWDGKYRGKYVSPGAYYYLIEYTDTKGKSHKRTGSVNVFRTKGIETEADENAGN